jgi:hypothetical protein
MSRKKPQLTKAGEPRKRAPGAGRPALGKIKLTVHILPETRAALGDKPGAVLDAHFGGSNDKAEAPSLSEVDPPAAG